MKRIVLSLLIFFVILVQVQNKPVFSQTAACPGEGNYCIGSVVQQFGIGCALIGSECQTSYGDVLTLSCWTADCTGTYSLSGGEWGECGASSIPPQCTPVDVPIFQTFNCCLYGGGGGGGGGSCDTTAPSNLSADWGYSATQARFSWTPGQGLMRVSQYFAISETLDSGRLSPTDTPPEPRIRHRDKPTQSPKRLRECVAPDSTR